MQQRAGVSAPGVADSSRVCTEGCCVGGWMGIQAVLGTRSRRNPWPSARPRGQGPNLSLPVCPPPKPPMSPALNLLTHLHLQADVTQVETVPDPQSCSSTSSSSQQMAVPSFQVLGPNSTFFSCSLHIQSTRKSCCLCLQNSILDLPTSPHSSASTWSSPIISHLHLHSPLF